MLVPVEAEVRILDLIYGQRELVVALITAELSVSPVELVAPNGTVYSPDHNFINNVRVQVFSKEAEVKLGKTDFYYVTEAKKNSFKLAEEKGGDPLAFPSDIDCSDLYVKECPLCLLDADASLESDIDVWIRHEAKYEQRQAYRPGFAYKEGGYALTPEQEVSFNTDVENVRYILVIRGGNVTPGSTEGTVEQFEDLKVSRTIEKDTALVMQHYLR